MDLTPGEDQKRSEKRELTAMILSLADVEKIRSGAYRAGREDAAKAIEDADTSGWPGGRGSDVDGCQERAAEIARGVQ